MDFNNFLNERRITIKRRYTENHPALEAGQSARVRNKILEAIADGSITTEEFENIVSEISNDSKRWVKRNSRYFSVSEEGVSLSKFGKRILKSIAVNEALINEEKSASEKLADEVSGELYQATLRGNSATVTATTTTQTWDDGVPVLKYLAKGKGKPVKMEKKVFNVVHDVAHGWFYFTDGRKWFGLHMEDGYYDPSDLPFDLKVAESVDEKTTKNPEVWVPGDFDKAVGKLKASQITREKIIELAKKYDVGVVDAIAYVEYGWSLDLSENNNTEMANNFIYESFTEFVNSLNENQQINEGKTENGKVVTAWKKTGLTDLDAIAKVYADAMEDANFHREIVTSKAIGSASRAKKMDVDPSNISSAAGWSGYAIANGTVDFLRSIDQEAAADKLYTAISKFNLNESTLINEAFKSSKLSSIANLNYGDQSFFKAVAAFTRVKLDQITDDQVVEMTPKEAYKTKAHPDALFFYISDNEKTNPYADRNSWNKNIPGNTLLAVANGRNEMFNVSWEKSWATKDNSKTLKNVGRYGEGHGVDKRHSGYGASGLSNIKRLSEVADRVLMFDPSILPSSTDQRVERAAAKKGAIAFMNDKEFKAINQKRYTEILSTKAAALPLDKEVDKAINMLTDQIKKGLAAGETTRYGDIKIGTNKKGNDVKLRDASNHMSSILDAYSNYVEYSNKVTKATQDGERTSYYTEYVKQYAKDVADKIKQIPTFDYAW